MKKDKHIEFLRKKIRGIIHENFSKNMGFSNHDKLSNFKLFIQENINTNNSDKLHTLIDVFLDEINGREEIRKYKGICWEGLKKRFISWLKEGPRILNIPHDDNQIKNLLYSMGYDEVKKMENNQIKDLYYNDIFNIVFEDGFYCDVQ